MIGRYFASLEGIAVFGLVALFVSIGIFLVIVVRALRADAGSIAAAARLPLDTPDELHAPTPKVRS
jgi:hypothetical protein